MKTLFFLSVLFLTILNDQNFGQGVFISNGYSKHNPGAMPDLKSINKG